jgi:hypothetical protein
VSLTVQDVVSFEGPRPEGHAPVRRGDHRSASPWPRRGFLKLAVAAGTGVGMAALGVFPAVRQARADHVIGHYTQPAYDILNHCPGTSPAKSCDGCGPSAICGSQNCCNPSTHPHYPKLHRNNVNVGGIYALRPGECASNSWDGWLWHVGPCPGCAAITFRCHDGYKLISGHWVPTICRHVVYCRQ